MKLKQKDIYINCLYDLIKKEKQKKTQNEQLGNSLIDEEYCCDNPSLFFEVLDSDEILSILTKLQKDDLIKNINMNNYQETENQILKRIQNAGLQKIKLLQNYSYLFRWGLLFAMIILGIGFLFLIAYIQFSQHELLYFQNVPSLSETKNCACLNPCSTDFNNILLENYEENVLVIKDLIKEQKENDEIYLTIHSSKGSSGVIKYNKKANNEFLDSPKPIWYRKQTEWSAFEINQKNNQVQFYEGIPTHECLERYKKHTTRGSHIVCFKLERYCHELFYIGVSFIFFGLFLFFFFIFNHKFKLL